ncbi:putative F-box domain-containing protein [Senna tora]|uniref:Putative F-box domain-containing protein n=1 Tax=Senna tora TaxID=362788 RepID=A0A834XHB1_9FABA|nr:putative F-box domain-containing protein [Senna tora]
MDQNASPSSPHDSFFDATGRKIMLPPPSTIPLPNNSATYFFIQVVASCTPDSSDCIVAARVYNINVGPMIVFCRVNDESWSLIVVDHENVRNFWNIAIHGNKLYAMNSAVVHYVIVFDLSDATSTSVNYQPLLMLNPKPNRIRSTLTYCNGYIFKVGGESYSVAIDSTTGEVYIVLRRIDGYLRGSSLAYSCSPIKGLLRVFKLDSAGPRWREVNDLGDNLLFVDANGGKVISASALNNNVSQQILVHPNSVYFAYSYVEDPRTQIYKHDVGYCCLTTKTMHRFSQNNWDSRFPTRALWFTPCL